MDEPGWTLEEVCSPDLRLHLGRLSAWLRSDLNATEWESILIAERLFLEPDRRLLLSADAIWTPAQYAERFAQHARAGYSWINLETIGLLNSALVTSIDLPRASTGLSRTQVLLSGPMRFVSDGPGWSLERYLRIEGASCRPS